MFFVRKILPILRMKTILASCKNLKQERDQHGRQQVCDFDRFRKDQIEADTKDQDVADNRKLVERAIRQ